MSHALWAAPRGGNETHLVRNAHDVDNERRWSARTLRKCGDVNEHSLHLLIAHNRTVLLGQMRCGAQEFPLDENLITHI